MTENGSLAFVPANVPLRAHEEALTRLLTRLDAVDSAGDARVRNHRRQLVLDIESELEDIEALKTAARDAATAAPADMAIEEPVVEASGAVVDSVVAESAAPDAPESIEAVSTSDTLIDDAAETIVAEDKDVAMASPARSRSPSLVSLASEDGYEIVA